MRWKKCSKTQAHFHKWDSAKIESQTLPKEINLKIVITQVTQIFKEKCNNTSSQYAIGKNLKHTCWNWTQIVIWNWVKSCGQKNG